MSKRTQLLLVGLVCFLAGCLAAQSWFLHAQPATANKLKWQSGWEVQARKSGESDFGDATKKWGVEVWKDPNNGNLIYLSETGSISVVPAK
jgi:hypothetical protein